ncbi:MAG: CoA-binding protein [Deltaproteobacteria bacterium]|nr:CoA-binding protein [Deltaproteobacteria bacterium]
MDNQTSIPKAVMDRLAEKGAQTRIAVVGASNDPEKYGNIITKNLSGKGYTVLPVNPKEPEIAGIPAFGNLASVPGPIHIVDFVTPPPVTLKVLQNTDPAIADAFWLQDGSFDDAVIEYAEGRFPNLVHHACIMVVSNY